jgi:hypothetical protein
MHLEICNIQGEYMKFTKMSLVAALLIGSSAFAIENTKVSGEANVFYGTQDAGTTNGLFDKDNSAADIGLNLNMTTDLMKSDMVSISAGVGATVLSTLGLENNFVSGVWGSSHTATTGGAQSYADGLGGAKVNEAFWVNEAWIAISAGKTTAKVGRMELDTPLAFTEKWTIEKNTFEAAVLINQDIPDTTLVAAFVGNGNGTETFGTGNAVTTPLPNVNLPTGSNLHSNVSTLDASVGGVVNAKGKFGTYGSDGAYAVAAINNSFKPLTVQAWYYNVRNIARAYWLQADLACEKIPGLMAGIQYSGLDIESTQHKVLGNNSVAQVKTDSDAIAGMIGFEMKDVATLKVAYSEIGKKHSAGQNTATDFVGGTAQSKLYTEAWWNYGYITQADTNSVTVSVTSPVNGMVDLGAYYTSANQTAVAGNNDMQEFTLTAGKTFGPLDATLAYVYTKADDQNDNTADGVANGEAYNAIQAYLTLNF